MNSSRKRLHLPAISGLLFILLAALPLGLLPPPPAVGDLTPKIVSYYQTYGSLFLLTTYLGVLGSFFFLWFLGYLVFWLKQARHVTYEPAIVLGAGICWITVFLLSSGLILSEPALASSPSTYSELNLLSNLTDRGFTINTLPAALLVGTTSLTIWRARLLPRWLSLLGLVVVLAQGLASLGMLFASGPLVPGGLVYDAAYVLLSLWVLCVSLSLLFIREKVLP